MSWNTKKIPDLSGRVAVVTGGTSGLGLASVRALAAAGAHTVLTARNRAKAERARAEILADLPDASIELSIFDLGSQAAVTKAGADLAKRHPRIDILMNNAGLMATPEGRTEDGWETQIGVNHFGHWTLTALLLPSILRAEAGRVVCVSSSAHYPGRPIDPTNVNMEGVYDPWAAYSRAKLANANFGAGLQRQFERAGVAAQAFFTHPGLSHTNLQVATAEAGGVGASGGFWKWITAAIGMSPKRGALTQLRPATDPDAKGGAFYGPRFFYTGAPVVARPSKWARDQAAIDTLWEVSAEATGIDIDVPALAAAAQ